MATNIIRDSNRTTVIENVGADYKSGQYIAENMLGGISLNDVSTGDDAVVQYIGEALYAKAAGETWTEGDPLFFDAGNDEFSTSPTTDCIIRAYAAEDALLAATEGTITMSPGQTAAVAGALAYDNSTSGLAATDVQGAIDEVDGRVDALVSDKMDLVTAIVAGDLLEMDASGQAVGSGLATADVQVLTVPAAAGNLAGLDVAGTLTDSGINAASIAGAVTMGGIYNDNMRNSTNTAQSTASETATLIDLEDVELAGNVTYDAGVTRVATIPAGSDGLYAIAWAAVFAAGAGTYNEAGIYINGAPAFDVQETPDSANPITCQDYALVRLSAGDTVGLWCKQDSGGALDVTSAYLAIQRIQ